MKNLHRYAAASIVTLALLSGCAKEPSPDDKVLAKVSNGVITVKDLNSRVAKLPAYYRDIIEKNKKRYLEEMIAEKLFYEEAIRRGLNNDREVAEVIAEAKKKIIIAKLIKNEVDDKVKVSESEMEQFYADNKDKLRTPELWRASQILVPTEQEAQDILRQLNAGADFAGLAAELSKDATASRGGDIGFFRAGQLVPDFEREALKLDIGQTSGVVHTKFGYHIIKLTDRKGPGVQSYDMAKPLIENELRKKNRAEMFYGLVMSLKKKYGVSVDEDAVGPDEQQDAAEGPEGS